MLDGNRDRTPRELQERLASLRDEYKTLRDEVHASIKSRNEFLGFGLAAVGVALGASTRDQAGDFEWLAPGLIVPGILAFMYVMWTGEYLRMARAGQHLAMLEARLNDCLGHDGLLSWETRRRKVQDEAGGRGPSDSGQASRVPEPVAEDDRAALQPPPTAVDGPGGSRVEPEAPNASDQSAARSEDGTHAHEAGTEQPDARLPLKDQLRSYWRGFWRGLTAEGWGRAAVDLHIPVTLVVLIGIPVSGTAAINIARAEPHGMDLVGLLFLALASLLPLCASGRICWLLAEGRRSYGQEDLERAPFADCCAPGSSHARIPEQRDSPVEPPVEPQADQRQRPATSRRRNGGGRSASEHGEP